MTTSKRSDHGTAEPALRAHLQPADGPRPAGGLTEIRATLLAEANGDVLEVGGDTGLNLVHYAGEVGTLTVTESDASMLRRLEHVVGRTGRPVTVLRAPAADLPFEDASLDTVVTTLVLCGVDDQPRAVREIRRVLKLGGRLLFVEHVRFDDPAGARRQDRINWLNRLAARCDCNRPTLRTLERGGLVIDDLVHGELPKSPTLVRPMIVGSATRPIDALTHRS